MEYGIVVTEHGSKAVHTENVRFRVDMVQPNRDELYYVRECVGHITETSLVSFEIHPVASGLCHGERESTIRDPADQSPAETYNRVVDQTR
jgi:hypothetical protein